MDRSYDSALENGRFQHPLETLLKIADGLASSVAALCSEAKDVTTDHPTSEQPDKAW